MQGKRNAKADLKITAPIINLNKANIYRRENN